MKHFADNIAVFRNLMVCTMRFQEFRRESNGEVFWQTSIPHTGLSIQVRSGMRGDGSYTPAPDIGIRLYLVDTVTLGAVAPVVRVRRTEHSLRKVREKVGVLWKLALELNKPKPRRS